MFERGLNGTGVPNTVCVWVWVCGSVCVQCLQQINADVFMKFMVAIYGDNTCLAGKGF